MKFFAFNKKLYPLIAIAAALKFFKLLKLSCLYSVELIESAFNFKFNGSAFRYE